MSEATIPIKELMEKTEQWLLGQGYKKSTLGFYRATGNRFLSYSASPAYSRETAEQFLLQYFGVDVHAIDQTLDGRMRHARRHMNALDEIFRTGTVCRRKVYGVASIDDDCFDKFFSDYLSYCKMQNFSRSWMDNTIAALRLFLLAVHSSNTQNIKSINAETINCFSTAMSNASEICMNVRRARCRQVGAYLHWLYDHKYTDLDYSLQLPNFKRTAPQIPQVWSPEEIDKILAVIDKEETNNVSNPIRAAGQRTEYRALLLKNIEYPILAQNNPMDTMRLDELVELMLDVVCSKRAAIRIAGENMPAEVVKSRFLKLNAEHIQYVLDCLKDNPPRIRNIKQYLLAALYNAPLTIENYYAAQIDHDLCGRN